MVSHWGAAMAMLDEVRPGTALRSSPRAPAQSPFVKRWCRAMLAWQVREQTFVGPVFHRHPLQVRVKNRRVNVKARAGYFKS